MSAPIGMGSLDDHVVHVPSNVHGMSNCGEIMRDPWRVGPIRAFEEWIICEQCFDLG